MLKITSAKLLRFCTSDQYRKILLRYKFFVGLVTLSLTACGGGGGGTGGSATIPQTTPATQTANYFPLGSSNNWTYQGGLNYTMGAPSSFQGQTIYPYQGGCNATEYLYKDSAGNVFSIGQTINGIGAPKAYPQPELLTKSQLSPGMTWNNNLGFVTESVSVGSPINLTINGSSSIGYPISYTDNYSPPVTATVVYVANIGPVQLPNFCTSPAVQATLTSYAISPTSI